MPPAEPETPQFKFDIMADYHQAYLDDCGLHEELTRVKGRDELVRAEEIDAHIATLLSPEAHARHLGVARGTLCILTARYDVVPVTVEIWHASPQDDFDRWDHVVEASLEIASGCIAVHGPWDYWPEVPRIAVAPGVYRARVYFGGVYTVSADEFDGEDHYRVALWPAPAAPPKVLHSRGTGTW